MEKALTIQKEVIKILGTDEVYLVGGSVRDIVMGNEPKDYDFTTPMLPEDIIEKVKAVGRRVYTIGERFGTIGFKVPVEIYVATVDSTELSEPYKIPATKYEYVEVTTFRSEVYTNKSRKPEVKFVPSLEEDLARRDFTMNAMVLRPDGTIYDPYGGKLDIHAKKIVTVGLPKDRIQEDPLRMLRAARFSARYGFSIDPNFIGKARQLAGRIYDVSVERWVQELDKLLTSKLPHHGLTALDDMGLKQLILPETNLLTWRVVNFDNPDEAWRDLLRYSIFNDERPNLNKVRYVNSGICHRLKFSNERTKVVLGDKDIDL